MPKVKRELWRVMQMMSVMILHMMTATKNADCALNRALRLWL
jgi:hypothetical protein